MSVSSVFARPNRRVSCGSRTNARTTLMPVICSRRIRFTVSIRVCMARNCGSIRTITAPIAATSTGTHTAISQDSPTSSRSAMTIPPTHMIGAATSMVQVVRTSIWTCCTSLVLRVISDGAPNRLNSRAENSPTRWNSALRTSRPKPIAVRAAVVDRGDRAAHLDQRDQQHPAAGAQDVAGVAGGDAVVDDDRRSGWAGRARPPFRPAAARRPAATRCGTGAGGCAAGGSAPGFLALGHDGHGR